MLHSVYPYDNVQRVVVSERIRENPALTTYRLASEDGSPLEPFIAGQFLSALVEINGVHSSRPYSIASSPALAQKGEYQISIEDFEGSFVAGYIAENWSEGKRVNVRAPFGDFYYDRARDGEEIVCIAGGSAVTPFLSMARALDDGTDDYKLTLLYGNDTWQNVPFREEFERIERGGRLKVVHVLSDETREGCESGFIDRRIIEKYAIEGGQKSIFICGPPPMYDFVDGELKALGIERRFIFHAPYAAPKELERCAGYKGDCKAVYSMRVMTREGVSECPCRADESLLVALERAGIKASCCCRSGICGECKVKLLEGEVYAAPAGAYAEEYKTEPPYIKSCYSFPLSDLCIELL